MSKYTVGQTVQWSDTLVTFQGVIRGIAANGQTLYVRVEYPLQDSINALQTVNVKKITVVITPTESA